MTNASPTGDFLQGFRAVSGPCSTPVDNSTIFIASRPDKKTGERIVLWRDIQREIKNADRIRNGNTSVSFMTDDDFEELVPQRILHHPGVILDVVVEGQEPDASVSTPTASQVGTTAIDNDCSTNGSGGPSSAFQRINTLSATAIDTLERRLVAQSVILEREEQKSLQRNGRFPVAQQTGDAARMQVKGLEMDDSVLDQLRGLDEGGMANNDIYHMYTIRMLHQMINRQVIIENKLQA
ncbi:hypothetical protein BGX31_003109, partial [Mortierella sp. GBA43]